MSSTVIYVGLPEDSKSSITKVPNAPKSCIAEIFSADTTDIGSSPKNGISRPRVVRDTPTRPRDTHSRLFGQVAHHAPAPMVTDTIRSNIKFGGKESVSPPSPPKMTNGSASSTPSREGNPITGVGYKSIRTMNGDISTVTTIYGDKSHICNLNRVPPGGYTTRLW